MSDATATEITPGQPRTPSRAVRKRDERVRRVVRQIRKDADFLDHPRYTRQLRVYAGLTIKFEILLANVDAKHGDNLLDELGHAVPALETLQRLGKACASIGSFGRGGNGESLGQLGGASLLRRHPSRESPELGNRRYRAPQSIDQLPDITPGGRA